MSDLSFNESKASSLLYLREDKVKQALNNFFTVVKNFERIILERIDDNKLGIADIKCLLIINLNPGITFNELMSNLDISKQSLNRVLKVLIKNNFISQEINNDDARKKNLYLSSEASVQLNVVLNPILNDIAKVFQKSGSTSVQGLNQIFNLLLSYDE